MASGGVLQPKLFSESTLNFIYLFIIYRYKFYFQHLLPLNPAAPDNSSAKVFLNS